MIKHNSPHSLIHRQLQKVTTTSTSTSTIRTARATPSLLNSINSIISNALNPTLIITRDTTTTTPTRVAKPLTTSTSSIDSIIPEENTLVRATTTTSPTTTTRIPTSRVTTSSIVNGRITSSTITVTPNSTATPSSTNLSTASSGSSNQSSSKSSRMSTVSIIVIVIVVLVVILLGIAAFFGFKHYQKKKNFARDEDEIIGNSAFRKEGEGGVGDDHDDDFGNSATVIGRNGSYSRNGGGNSEKFGNGYGSLAGESPGPNSYNNNQYASSSPLNDKEGSGFAGRGTQRNLVGGGESHQFIQVSSPMGVTPTYISSPPPTMNSNSNYGSTHQQQQNLYNKSPYTQTSQPSPALNRNFSQTRQPPPTMIDYIPFNHNDSSLSPSGPYPYYPYPTSSASGSLKSRYPPTAATLNSTTSSNANLLREQQYQEHQQELCRNPSIGGLGGIEGGGRGGAVAYNPSDESHDGEKEDVGSAMMINGDQKVQFEEEEDNRVPLETIGEEGSLENGVGMPIAGGGPFGESENQGQIFSVKRTFEPTMPDELVIFPGDKVLLLMKYDDGWALGEKQSHNSTSKGPLRGVFPYDCLESSTLPPTPSNVSTLSPPSHHPESINQFSAPQLAPIKPDSPLVMPSVGFNKSQSQSTTIAPQVPAKIDQFQPTHSHQASLVNPPPTTSTSQPPLSNLNAGFHHVGIPDTPMSPNFGSESDILGDYHRASVSPSPAVLEGNGNENGNRSGEKSKRTSSLKASRDADLFVALGGVLEGASEDDHDHQEI